MVDLATRKARAAQSIEAARHDLRSLSLALHARPELNFHEVHAHGLLTTFLEQRGFAVTRGAYGLPTAFQAVAGTGRPRVAILCEYDALPEIGHACGHNLIAAAGVAVGLALKEAVGAGDGTIVVLGSPAEEGGGGKIYLAERHAFDGVDAAMMLHPFPFSTVRPYVIAIHTLEVEFFGKAAHAAAMPHEGVNALDAMVLAYNGIAMLRQQLRADEMVHGIITNGGAKPNIIPDHTAGEFYVRARDDASLNALKDRVLACFEGAARATGCRLVSRWVGPQYSNLTTNAALADAYVENARAVGVEVAPGGDEGASAVPFSTDMGNISHLVPSIHPTFAIETRGGNHTPEFAEAAATEAAHIAMLDAAKALAMTALDVYYRPEVLDAARRDFRESHGGGAGPAGTG
jgi:amidohydrolase